MRPLFSARRRAASGFSLVELLVVMAIIALMASLFTPAFQKAMAKARSMKCAGNLRVIGTAASLAAIDNNNAYPAIDQAGAPIYTPPGPSILTALGTYGVTAATLQCPIDGTGTGSSYKTYGSSYEWDPVFDNEPLNELVVYISPTFTIPVNSSRVRLAMDFTGVHNGRPNVVYGDGHVSTH